MLFTNQQRKTQLSKC